MVLAAGCGGDEDSSARGEDSRDPQRHAGGTNEVSGERRPNAVSGERRENPRPPRTGFPATPVLVERAQPETVAHLAQLRQREREKTRARRLPHTREAGCEKAVFPLAQGRVIWGPPTPRILIARRVGGSVSIRFAFERFPRLPGCRPFALTASVVSGTLDDPNFRLSDRRFQVVAPTGTATVPLPAGGPYTARLQAWTLDGRPTRQVEASVK